jgi:hypothetical protein
MASISLAYPFTRLTLLYSKHQHKTMRKLRFLVLLSILALGCQQKNETERSSIY